MKTRLVYYAHCRNVGGAAPIRLQNYFNITLFKNVISMRRSVRRQKCMCTYIANRSMAVSEVRISKAISYATKALGYSELRPNQELAVKHFLLQAVAKAFATTFFPRPLTFYDRGYRAPVHSSSGQFPILSTNQ